MDRIDLVSMLFDPQELKCERDRTGGLNLYATKDKSKVAIFINKKQAERLADRIFELLKEETE